MLVAQPKKERQHPPSAPTVEERGNVSRICEIMTKMGGYAAIWDARKVDRCRGVLKIVSDYMKAYDDSRKSFWPVQIDKAAVEGWTEDSVWSNAPAIKDLLVKFTGYSEGRTDVGDIATFLESFLTEVVRQQHMFTDELHDKLAA